MDASSGRHVCVGDGTTKCAQCTWARNKDRWQKEYTLEACLPEDLRNHLCASGLEREVLRRPWVQAAMNDGTWGVGCVACRELPKEHLSCRGDIMASFQGQTARGVRKDLFSKHQKTDQHRKAVLLLLGMPLSPNGVPLVGVLELQVFEDALARLREGTSARRMDNGGTGETNKHIRWCVLEALASQDRAFLREAVTMVICRDERHGRLLVRYAACKPNLESRRGTLGVIRDYGAPSAENILKATQGLFKQFCTRRLGKPRSMRHMKEPAMTQVLYQHLRDITEMVVNDSAASQLLAA